MVSNDVLDKNYSAVYKPIVKFLYTHPDFHFTFSISGKQIQFFKRRRNELIAILKELIQRKQIEILGGGYNDPILPLLSPVDRNGQIDFLSTEIRQTMGKRPRGISLFDDCWDSSLVNSLQTCGIEYIILESSIIPENKRKFLPLIMNDLGKSIEIFPYYDEFIPHKDTEPEDFIKKIIKSVEKTEKKDTYLQCNPERIVNISLSHEEIIELYSTNWFEKLYDYMTKQPDSRVKFITTDTYRKNDCMKIPAYVTAGINGKIARWINVPFTETDTKKNQNFTVYDFMEAYPQSRALYNRIMYISMLVNQYKTDKMRKNSARAKLWEAQNGAGLLCTQNGVFSNSQYRQQSYKALMEAEKILREDGKFRESILSFDYNGDGKKEYVCRMQNYFSYITLVSGALQELEIIKNTGNYADNLSRVEEYDKTTDGYERGFFIDHIFSNDDFNDYIEGKPAGNGIFSKIQYRELKFSQNHHEIQLYAEAKCLSTMQKVYLKKKYIVNSTGMSVQYIIRNESDKKFSAKFAVESNIAHTNFVPENITYYTLEAVDSGEKIEIDTSMSSKALNKKGKLKNVSIARITDSQSGISFSFEPNENCSYCFNPLIFKRPNATGEELTPVHMTFVNTLFWDINLEPGMETEKNINFSIVQIKKTRNKQ